MSRYPNDDDPPIGRELTPADDAALERIWRRLETAPPPRAFSWAAGVGIAATAAVAVALVYGLVAATPGPKDEAVGTVPSPSASSSLKPATANPAPRMPHTPPLNVIPTESETPAPRTPARPRLAPPPPALPVPTPTASAPTAPAPVVPAPDLAPPDGRASPTPPASVARRVVDRLGPTDAGSAALLAEARDAAATDAPRGAAIAEAGLAAGIPPSAPLYVLISDGWAAAGERARAARAARAALRAAPDGPHAPRMRQRALPDLRPR